MISTIDFETLVFGRPILMSCGAGYLGTNGTRVQEGSVRVDATSSRQSSFFLTLLSKSEL